MNKSVTYLTFLQFEFEVTLKNFVEYPIVLCKIKLFSQVENVIKLAEKVCLQRDKLIEEKREAITVLGERYKVNMVDLAVERIVHQWVKDMLECKQRIGELDRHIRELSNDIKTLKMIGPYQIKRRERTIEELEDQLEKKIFQVRMVRVSFM